MTSDAFWDASVLVPLCVEQWPQTAQAQKLLEGYAVCVWWGTPVEIFSALARLQRSGFLTDSEFVRSQAEMHRMAEDWLVVVPSDRVRMLALELLPRYPLRAGDALQLAAAMAWCEEQPKGKVFLTADKRLAEAAELAGFALEPRLIES